MGGWLGWSSKHDESIVLMWLCVGITARTGGRFCLLVACNLFVENLGKRCQSGGDFTQGWLGIIYII